MKVSVIIPNYNHASYLNQRIRSILEQTYTDFELIILDDHSSDNSIEIIESWKKRHPGIRFIRNESNSGSPFSQWDKGVRISDGEFIWIAESDDFADTRFLEKSVRILESNEKLGLVYSNAIVIDEKEGKEFPASRWNSRISRDRWLNDYSNNGFEELTGYLYLDCIIHNVSGVLFRKSRYIEAGLADHSMKYCGDWFLYIRMMQISDLAYISEALNFIRLNSLSTYYSFYRSNRYLSEVIRIHKYIRKLLPLTSWQKYRMMRLVLHIVRKRMACILSTLFRKD